MNPTTIAAVVLFACLAGYGWRADFERYSIFTVGVFKRVKREAVEPGEFECADTMCSATTERAEKRRYYKEIVVAAFPVLRYGGGTSYYCEDHYSFEFIQHLDEDGWQTTDRVHQRLGMAAIEAILWLIGETGQVQGLEDESEFSNASSDVTTGMSDAMSLMPVVFLVLIAAVILGATNRVIDG